MQSTQPKSPKFCWWPFSVVVEAKKFAIFGNCLSFLHLQTSIATNSVLLENFISLLYCGFCAFCMLFSHKWWFGRQKDQNTIEQVQVFKCTGLQLDSIKPEMERQEEPSEVHCPSCTDQLNQRIFVFCTFYYLENSKVNPGAVDSCSSSLMQHGPETPPTLDGNPLVGPYRCVGAASADFYS